MTRPRGRETAKQALARAAGTTAPPEPRTAAVSSPDLGRCRSQACQAPIRWALTLDGKRMPVDPEPVADGNMVRVQAAPGDWRVRVLAADEDPGDVPRWTSHYATCPDADRFRSRAEPAAAGRAPLQSVPEPAPPPPDPDGERPACPSCGAECAAVEVLFPLVLDDDGQPATVLVERQHPTGDLVAAQVDGRWGVRPVTAGDYGLSPGLRRLRHWCRVYLQICQSPGHREPVPARLYPGGAFCDPCVAETVRATIRPDGIG